MYSNITSIPFESVIINQRQENITKNVLERFPKWQYVTLTSSDSGDSGDSSESSDISDNSDRSDS